MEIVLANCWKEVFDYYISRRSQVIRGFWCTVSIQFFRAHTGIFQSPYKCFFPCPIAIKFSLMIDYRLKFVKM